MSQETFDLADLKEGEEFTEEISVEDDSGKETLVARSTFKVPKASVGLAAVRSSGKKDAPFLVKTEYFSEDFQPMAKTRSQPDQRVNLGAIWKIVKPIGEWLCKEFQTETHEIVDHKGNNLATPRIGMVAHHAVETDYYNATPIHSERVNIKVRNWNGAVGINIKGIRMAGTSKETNKAKELLSDGTVGLPGTYIDDVYVTVDSSEKGRHNHVTGYAMVRSVHNGNTTGHDIIDASLALSVHFKYGNFNKYGLSWERTKKFYFKALASEKTIKKTDEP